MLQCIHQLYKILAICVERSFVNKSLIASVGYQNSEYTWACKTVGGILGDLSEPKIIKTILKHGKPLDRELA